MPQDNATLSYTELVVSDFVRYRPGSKASWPHMLLRIPTIPGLLASIILRAQQCLYRAGHPRLSQSLRTLSNVVIGVDIGPPLNVGPGLMLVHPVGVTIGYGITIGANVTFAGGVTAAARYYDPGDDQVQEMPTIADGAVIGAHAVLVGGVRIGTNAMVGANSVVLSDVPDGAVVMGSPARQVGTREGSA